MPNATIATLKYNVEFTCICSNKQKEFPTTNRFYDEVTARRKMNRGCSAVLLLTMSPLAPLVKAPPGKAKFLRQSGK